MSAQALADMPPEPEAFGPEQFAGVTSVSRETLDRLKTYAGLLEDWNSRHNLISKSSMKDLWRRHFWDSAQLAELVPSAANTLVDLGAGAGFPGLVLAIMRPELRVTLIEATGKKCRFLEAVAGALQLKTRILNERVEDTPQERFDVITARACAPLPLLLSYAQRFWGEGSYALFHKGQNLASELTEAHKSWRIKIEQHSSRSDPSGIILEIRELQRVARKPSPL
jgi:16S rRNA (guanine527-N7)-methyltransferase